MASPSRTLALLVFAPAFALAADLGRLTVLSSVGEPLRAEIEIVALGPGEAASLAARIPPPDVFWRANLEPPPILDALRARVEPRPKGRYVVALRSDRPIEDPFMQLLVQLDSSTGRVVREYPFLLEEPRSRAPGAAAVPFAPPVARAPDGPSAGEAPSLSGAPAADGTYVVKPGDTLAGIARATRSPEATVEQTIVALFLANEQAFTDGNINRLPAGAVLALPPEGAARDIEPADALRLIRAHRAAFDEVRRHASRRAAAGPATTQGPASGGASGTVASGVAARRASGDQVRLTRPMETGGGVGVASESARDDDIAALQRALAEAQERIALLQRNLEDVRRLLTLKGQQPGNMERSQRIPAELAARIPGDATAAEQRNDGPAGDRQLHGFIREHAAWLFAAFLLAFGCWVVMPLKTVRAWRLRRRRQAREVRDIALDVRRRLRRAPAPGLARIDAQPTRVGEGRYSPPRGDASLLAPLAKPGVRARTMRSAHLP